MSNSRRPLGTGPANAPLDESSSQHRGTAAERAADAAVEHQPVEEEQPPGTARRPLGAGPATHVPGQHS